MELIKAAIEYVVNQPLETWLTIAGYLGGSTVIAVILQFLKKRFNIDSKKVVMGLLSSFTALASVADYLVTNNVGAPLPELAHTWAYLMALAVVIHRFAVSPLYARLSAAVQRFLAKVDASQASKPSVAAPAVPVLPPFEG